MNARLRTPPMAERRAAMYAAGYWRNDTIFSLTRQHAEACPEAAAIRDRRGQMTYGALAAAAKRYAETLHQAGLQPGDRVAVWLPSRAETAIALVACSRNGYACCPSLHRDHTTANVAALLKRMGAAALVGETGYGATPEKSIFEAAAQIESLRSVVELAPVDRAGPARLPGDDLPATPPSSDPDQVVYLAFTSGTSGAPKGVMHSDNTLLTNARAMIADWRFDQTSVFYTMSPLSHNLGLGTLIMALATGGEAVVHDLARGASVLDRLVDVGSTFIVGVPTHAIDLINEIKASGAMSPGHITGFRISGAAAAAHVVEDLLHHGIVPQTGYGMTEAGSHHYTRREDPPARMVGTSGRACESYEVAIWDMEDQDRQLGPGEEGQIGGRGASLMLGYFDDDAANVEAFNKAGWFMTGDLGRLDEAGYLQITGRKKDLIIRGGHNIYPAHIEELASRHPAIARAAAVPVADARLGERVCLAVTLEPGRSVEPADLLAQLDDAGLSRYDMPEYLLRLEAMPLTPSGKIFKRAIAEQIADGMLAPTPVRWQPPPATSEQQD